MQKRPREKAKASNVASLPLMTTMFVAHSTTCTEHSFRHVLHGTHAARQLSFASHSSSTVCYQTAAASKPHQQVEQQKAPAAGGDVAQQRAQPPAQLAPALQLPLTAPSLRSLP